MAQIEEFTFQNVAYRPTVYRTGSFGKRYEIDLRVIFYRWPKLGLWLDVEAEIQILKVIY